MRVTESELRHMVRRVLREAPLADLYPPLSPAQPTRRAMQWVEMMGDENAPRPQRPEDVERLQKLASSGGYRNKMTRIMSGFPMEVSVLPVTQELRTGISGPGERLYVIDRSQIAQKMSELIFEFGEPVVEAVESWDAAAPDGACLFVSYQGYAPAGTTMYSPYMMLHAIFDNESVYDMLGVTDLEEIFYLATDALGEMGVSPASDVKKIEKFELCFPSMKPAETKHYSRFPRNVDDWPNDVATHCLLKKGFDYDPSALREFCETEGCDFGAVASKFDKIKELRATARDQFMSLIRNKVFFINT